MHQWNLINKVYSFQFPQKRKVGFDALSDIKKNNAVGYWEEQYTIRPQAHSDQNICRSRDFLAQLHQTENAVIHDSIQKISSLLEFGCGTGELLNLIMLNYPTIKRGIGIDISEAAIHYAQRNYQNPKIEYLCYDALKDGFHKVGNFEMIISSNTLEHFKNPYVVIDQILLHCKECILIFPYNQPCIDGYSEEGGPGHVFTFNEFTMSNYNIMKDFKFTTNAWTHSVYGEMPQLWTVFLKSAPL